MRKIISFLCFFLISASFLLVCCTGESGDTSNPNGESDNPNEEVAANDSLVLSIEGMMCPSGCAKPIEEKLASCAGVSNCVVYFENQTAFVRYDNASITPDSMIQVVAAFNDGAYKASVKEAL